MLRCPSFSSSPHRPYLLVLTEPVRIENLGLCTILGGQRGGWGYGNDCSPPCIGYLEVQHMLADIVFDLWFVQPLRSWETIHRAAQGTHNKLCCKGTDS